MGKSRFPATAFRTYSLGKAIFQNFFMDASPVADLDADGDLTIFDFLAFQNAFDAGC